MTFTSITLIAGLLWGAMTVPAGEVKAHFSHPRISNSDEVTIVRVRGCEITQADHGDG